MKRLVLLVLLTALIPITGSISYKEESSLFISFLAIFFFACSTADFFKILNSFKKSRKVNFKTITGLAYVLLDKLPIDLHYKTRHSISCQVYTSCSRYALISLILAFLSLASSIFCRPNTSLIDLSLLTILGSSILLILSLITELFLLSSSFLDYLNAESTNKLIFQTCFHSLFYTTGLSTNRVLSKKARKLQREIGILKKDISQLKRRQSVEDLRSKTASKENFENYISKAAELLIALSKLNREVKKDFQRRNNIKKGLKYKKRKSKFKEVHNDLRKYIKSIERKEAKKLLRKIRRNT